jgi:hypothetical protein
LMVAGRRRGRVKRLAVASFSCRAALLMSDSRHASEELRDRNGRCSGLGGPLDRRCSAVGVMPAGDTTPLPPMLTRRFELCPLAKTQPFGALGTSRMSVPSAPSASLYRRSVCTEADATRGGSCGVAAPLSMARSSPVHQRSLAAATRAAGETAHFVLERYP